jgi:uncharacterized protein YndB with AHSA1/START domain
VAEPLVELERRLPVPPEEVFAYLTDPARYVEWMGTAAELDPKPGGRYRVQVGTHVALGEYVEVTTRRIVFTWGWEGSDIVPPGSTMVEISLTPEAEGTLMRLRHSGLPAEPDASMHREGWERYLGRLVSVAAGSDPDDASD